MLWFSTLFIIWNLHPAVTSDESCYQYRRKSNVTIDTDQCSYGNYTEPKTKRFCLDSCFGNDSCIGVAMIDEEITEQCCSLHQTEVRTSQPGDQILYHHKGATIQCKRGWSGNNCDVCGPNFEPPGQYDQCMRRWAGEKCNVCAIGWAGYACDGCATGWKEIDCDACDVNFGPVGLCDGCLIGWTGENCSECDRGWTGSGCDACAKNFGPPGQCDTCLTGFTGQDCQYCEGFGFSTESNCNECFQNGLWKGRRRSTDMEVYFTFTGSSCSELMTGTAMKIGSSEPTVASGSLDEANKIRRFESTWGHPFTTSIADDKSLSRSDNSVSLTYRGMF